VSQLIQSSKLNKFVIRRRIFEVIPYIILVFLLGVSLLPLIAMLGTSFRSYENMYTTRTIFPNRLSTDFYRRVLGDQRIYRYLWNSLRTAVVSAFVTVVFSVLGGYSMARFRKRVPGIKYYIFFILGFNMFPTMQMLIPLYLNFARLGVTNKPYSLMLIYPAFTLPMSLMVMESFIAGVPYEMEEAGRIDGCNRLEVIVRLVLPVAAPGIATALVLAFNHCWNEFLIALLLIKEDIHRTMPIGLNNYVQENISDWGSIMACATIMLIPVLLFLNILQKHIVSGLTMGSVKG
jgi:multiple sugar transport system permease protein